MEINARQSRTVPCLAFEINRNQQIDTTDTVPSDEMADPEEASAWAGPLMSETATVLRSKKKTAHVT